MPSFPVLTGSGSVASYLSILPDLRIVVVVSNSWFKPGCADWSGWVDCAGLLPNLTAVPIASIFLLCTSATIEGVLTIMVVLHLNAGHTVNGNPRRVYVVIGRDGCIKRAIDEGYNGISALWTAYPRLKDKPVYPVQLDTTPAEYRRLLREYR